MKLSWRRLTAWTLVPWAAVAPACRRAEGELAPVPAQERVRARYRCPMHPRFTSEQPGPCAICGMNVVAVTDEGEPAGRAVAGRAVVALAPESRQRLGVRVDVVRRTHLYRMLRTLGRVAKERAPAGRPRSVQADLYETDLTSLSRGMAASVMVAYRPGKAWTGRVTEIAPDVDEATRTFAVRLAVDDPAGDLRGGMIVDVVLKCDLGVAVLVPDTAVLSSGSRQLAFVERPADGALEPRELRLGPDLGFGFPVLAGLEDGERVVTSATFLVDAEATLRGAVALLASPGPR